MSNKILPFWTPNVRAAPKALVFSALFAPLKKGRRAYVRKKEIAAVGEYTISYTGELLDQSDLDVFLWLLHENRKKAADTEITFNVSQILRDIGLVKSKGTRDWLNACLTRLQACSVEVRKGMQTYSGSLVNSHFRDEKTLEYKAELNPRIADLMDPTPGGGYTQIHFEQRAKLRRQQLARWLHAFTTGANFKPLTFSLTSVHELCGGGYSRLREFRSELDIAAEHVNKAGAPLSLTYSRAGSDETTLVTFRRGEPKDPPAITRGKSSPKG